MGDSHLEFTTTLMSETTATETASASDTKTIRLAISESEAKLLDAKDAAPLDGRLFNPSPDQSKFLKSETGIDDDDALKQHIVSTSAKAYSIRPYPCIFSFSWINLLASRNPIYNHVLTLGKQRPNAVLLDVGCCFGADARKAVADGYPSENVIAADVNSDLWKVGLELFQRTSKTLPIAFVSGDVFDTSFIAEAPVFEEAPEGPIPPLSSLTSLTPLLGRISAIHASLLFHLFSEERQELLARTSASLLSPDPGSVIFGAHAGRPEKGFVDFGPHKLFCHSPESWTELWNGTVFPKGKVEVGAKLITTDVPWMAGGQEGAKFDLLVWFVKRI